MDNHMTSYLKTMIIWASENTAIVGQDELVDKNKLSLCEGDIFGRYIVESKIDSGGFSDVYKVRHKHLHHRYALKVFNDMYAVKKKNIEGCMSEAYVAKSKVLDQMTGDCSTDIESVERISSNPAKYVSELKNLFFNEAQNLATLNHPNVVKVFDVGVIDTHAYILLEYLEDNRLDSVLEKTKMFTEEKTLDLLEDMVKVLIEQEKHDIVHGDIKPQNIFLRKNNTFCIIDYGNMNNDDITAYTKAYMSPEHESKTLTIQSDLYQLGLVAWQCLSGATSEGLLQYEFSPKELQKLRTDVSPMLIKILSSLLKENLLERYKSPKNLLEDIELMKYHDEEPVGTVKGSVFIAISYDKCFNSVYQVLNKISHTINFKCIRMDRLHFQDEIWKNIALEIENSNIMIADFSEVKEGCGTNSNVITEASHARAIGKQIIIITQERPEDLPFDWRYLTIIEYSNTEDGLKELAQKIYNKLRVIDI